MREIARGQKNTVQCVGTWEVLAAVMIYIPILKVVIFCEHPVKKGWSNIEMLSYLETRESDDTNCT